MDIEQLEALALSDDRTAALAALVAGSEDHDYWHAIELQHRGAFAEVDAILAAWPTRHGDTERRQRVARRQRLLLAGHDLDRHAAALIDELEISLDHQPEIEAAATRYRSQLEPALVDEATLIATALGRGRGLDEITAIGLPALLATELDPHRRRQLLERLDRTGLAGLVGVIAADLADKSSRGFGSLAIHHRLTRDELDELARLRPALVLDPTWVGASLRRLRPAEHVDWQDDVDARIGYLDALWAAVAHLSVGFAALKAHVLYHRLACDLRTERFDRERLRAYLSLPRSGPGASAAVAARFATTALVALDHGLVSATELPAIGDDGALVRAYVGALVAATADPELAEVLDPAWLTRVIAEERLVAGATDARWATHLGAEATAALRDRVDLELLPTNPTRWSRDGAVALDVAVKNVATLRVRVFRINTAAFFAARGGDVDVTIDLDGLAAGWEEVRELTAPPMLRQRLRLELAACDRPGTYVVELIGAGKASRALVRRGELRCAARPSAGGITVDVVDELGRPCPQAALWLGGREHPARASGGIALPFTTRPGWTPVLLVDGDVAVATQVELRGEAYQLGATWLLDRQGLIPGEDAIAIARLELGLGGVPVTLAVVEEPYVEIVTTDRRGVVAKHRQPITVDDGVDLEVRFPVPPHLVRLALGLGGRVRIVSEQRTIDLRHDAAIEVGTMHGTAVTAGFHLVPGPDGYRLALLGKSGEPRAGRPVVVKLECRAVTWPIEVTLATDVHGEVVLGRLPGVGAVSATAGEASQRFELWALVPIAAPRIIARAGVAIVVPTPTDLTGQALAGERWSLVELRGGAPAHDWAANVVTEPGRLIARELPAGSYQLRALGVTTTLTVVPTAAPEARGWASTPAGLLELSVARATTAAVAVTDHGLEITVAEASPHTRLHLVATAFAPAPAWDPRLAASIRGPIERGGRLARAAYVSGRDIGDEYRYVLDRQRQPRRAGVLLDKPSLLLNPWSLRTTATSVQAARGGGGWAGAPSPAAAAPCPPPSPKLQAQSISIDPAFTAYDFLAAPPIVLANLKPDGAGRVTVPRTALGGAAHVHLVCVDPSATTHHRLAVAAPAVAVRDLRLAAPLPLDQHVREDRRLAAVAAGATIAVADRATSRVELVDSVDKLYRALCALSGDATLAAWDFVPRWSTLSEAERWTLYSRHACHELALFIYTKDRPLFERGLRPYLASKLHKTLIDHWLLDADLTPYLEPWRLARCNALELALLAQRCAAAGPGLPRRLADAVELIVPDPSADDRLVDTFIAGGALGGDGAGAAVMLAEELDDAMSGDKGGGFGLGGLARSDDAPARPRPEKAKRSRRAEAAADEADEDLAVRESVAPLFRSADKTQEWAEHNWWHTRVDQIGPERVPVGRLWRDLAGHRAGPFLSPHVGDAVATFTAAMAALAFIELPFVASPHAIVARGAGAEVTAGSHALAAVVELATVPGPPIDQVLVGQSYFRADDRWDWDGAEQVEKYVTGELLTTVVYACQVVVTNPTSRTQRVSALHQIPAGAIAVGGAIATATERLDLEPYQSETFEYAFYFPHPAEVDHYGAQITRTAGAEPTLLAAVAPRRLTVVATASQVDVTSWPHLAQHGTLDEVCGFLAARNLGRIDLAQIAWRARDRAAFTRLTATLAARGHFDDAIWGYAVHHRDRARTGEWLAARGAELGDLGPVLATALFAFEPVERAHYQHLEYAPLINARAHRLGDRRAILNDGLAEQWQRFLDQAAHRARPRAEDWLAAAHYLFALDRADDATRALARVDGAGLAGAAGLQADYLHAYAAIVGGDLAVARARVARHADHPVDRWRTRFAALTALIAEAGGGPGAGVGDRDSRDQVLAAAAAQAPSLSARVDGAELVIDHAGVTAASLRLYRMDLELLFSRQPFFGGDTTRFGFIEPGVTQALVLAERGPTRVGLPAELRRHSVVIELVAGAVRHTTTHFAHELAVAVTAPYGLVAVRHAVTGAARVAAYVKCYARQRDGAVQFYKDGYTDLCGRFDYATLSTDDLDRVERFALLIVDDSAGATVIEAAPPAR